MLINNKMFQYVSFFGKNPSPIYSICENEIKKYPSQNAAAEDIGVSVSAVNGCVGGRLKTVHSHIFVDASTLEDENGNLDMNKVRFTVDERINRKSVYVVDKNLNYQKFITSSAASRFIDAKALEGASKKDFLIVSPSEIEVENPDGSISIDNNKVLDIIRKKYPDKALYSIDKKGNMKRYDNPISAYRENTSTAMYPCLKGLIKTAMGKIFVPASEIEKISDEGIVSIDTEKVQNLINERFSKNRVYVIDVETGSYEKFETSASAHQKYANGEKKEIPTSNYLVVKSDEIEIKNQDGETFVDEAKIKFLIEQKKQRNALYSIDENGNFVKYKNRKEAVQKTGVSQSSISSIINGRTKTIKGFSFVDAATVEVLFSDGTIKLDENKIRELSLERFAK